MYLRMFRNLVVRVGGRRVAIRRRYIASAPQVCRNEAGSSSNLTRRPQPPPPPPSPPPLPPLPNRDSSSQLQEFHCPSIVQSGITPNAMQALRQHRLNSEQLARVFFLLSKDKQAWSNTESRKRMVDFIGVLCSQMRNLDSQDFTPNMVRSVLSGVQRIGNTVVGRQVVEIVYGNLKQMKDKPGWSPFAVCNGLYCLRTFPNHSAVQALAHYLVEQWPAGKHVGATEISMAFFGLRDQRPSSRMEAVVSRLTGELEHVQYDMSKKIRKKRTKAIYCLFKRLENIFFVS